MWIAKCLNWDCQFEEVSSQIYDKYWNEEKEECICPQCGEVLDVERW